MLDEAVADGDLVAGVNGDGGGGGGVDGGVGRRENVPQGCVGGGERGLEGHKLQACGAHGWRCWKGKGVAAPEGWRLWRLNGGGGCCCDGAGGGVAHGCPMGVLASRETRGWKGWNLE